MNITNRCGKKALTGPQTPPGSLLYSVLSFLLRDLALGSRGETCALCPVLGHLLPAQVSPSGIRRVAEAGCCGAALASGQW